MDVIGDIEMPQDHARPPHRAMCANAGAARHAHTAGHGHMSANVRVVANLDEIVELDAVFNDGVVQRATVNAGVGADFDIIANADAAQLFNLDPLALMWREAKTIAANHRSAFNQTALANRAARCHRDALAQDSVRANPCAAAHKA